MQFKKFKSLDGIEKRIALLSGHTFLIGQEWVDIPETAWDEAYANKCISSDYLGNFIEKEVPDRAYIIPEKLSKTELDSKIRQTLIDMLIEGNPENFDELNNNYPKITIVREKANVGMQCAPALVKKIWEEILEEKK